eukprot:5990611-Amphidinium_carterae.1
METSEFGMELLDSHKCDQGKTLYHGSSQHDNTHAISQACAMALTLLCYISCEDFLLFMEHHGQ